MKGQRLSLWCDGQLLCWKEARSSSSLCLKSSLSWWLSTLKDVLKGAALVSHLKPWDRDCGVCFLMLIWLLTGVMTLNSFLLPLWKTVSSKEKITDWIEYLFYDVINFVLLTIKLIIGKVLGEYTHLIRYLFCIRRVNNVSQT